MPSACHARNQILHSPAAHFNHSKGTMPLDYAATVMGNYDLLAGERTPPLLVASGSADPQKP
jgi:hypothetical protein